KLTPNVGDVTAVARAAVRGGADALSLINTVNSIMGVDLDTLAPKPAVRGYGSHGGYCGPAVKPIALHMTSAVAGDAACKVPISGIGGIQAWQDAVEFLLLGAGSVQVCTAVMHYGFRIVEQLASGLENWMREKGYNRISEFVGKSTPRIRNWGELDLNYKVVAEIDQKKCIHCGLCYIACEDGAHQSIRWDRLKVEDYVKATGATMVRSGDMEVLPGAGDGTVNQFTIKQDTCVGCNLCSLVCPVQGCIHMKEVDTGKAPMSWNEYQKLLAEGKVAKIEPPAHV
ncbi:MAG: NAD-dependent dihydropyrimidine dehydrogenase subunit PreA, partial [Gemmataceae bacterium]|nr:NAD-dependent dihydropyrimidine dehydrogenase subunit PreA [Gemmataceae bacterium]